MVYSRAVLTFRRWDLKEQDYKYELKKLEVLLSQTEGGLEKVTLARSKSTVHGSRRVGDTIGRGVGTVKERNEDRCSAGTGWSNMESSFSTLLTRKECQIEPSLTIRARTTEVILHPDLLVAVTDIASRQIS